MLSCASKGVKVAEIIKIDAACSYGENERLATAEVLNEEPTPSEFVRRILYYSGVPNKFKTMMSNVPNAAAAISGGERYILINPKFMDSINAQAGSNWAAISILAHEIGHHLSGHTLGNQGSRPDNELEADYYSGYVLGMMGAELVDAQSAMQILQDPEIVTTHPKKIDRLSRIEEGWHTAQGNKRQLLPEQDNSKIETADEIRGRKKKKAKRKKKGRMLRLQDDEEAMRQMQQAIVNFSDFTTQHNVTQGDQAGMLVQFKVDIRNPQSKNFGLLLVFYDKDKQLIRDRNGLWSSSDGIAIASQYHQITNQGGRIPHAAFFFPYQEIEVDLGEHQLSYAVRYYEIAGPGQMVWKAESAHVPFTLRK